MRLATCIALELAVAASAVTGAWLGISRGAELAGSYIVSRDAAAATVIDLPVGGVVPLERGRLAVARPLPDTVFAAPDLELLAPLGASPVARVKFNRGGSSLSLRIEFASGARAAYRIDRLLAIGHVPPARSGVFAIEDLVAAVDPGSRSRAVDRLAEEAIARDGKLCGELSWWIPEIKRARIGGHYVDEPDGEALWTAYLQAGATMPGELVPMLAQIATVIVFDVVIDNSDRWSGNNTQGSADERVLYFMDNTLAFSQFTLGHTSNLSKLYRIQVFPRRLIGRLRALTADSVAAALGRGDDLLGPLLGEVEIRALLSRRDHLVEYVDRLIAELGEEAVLALP